MSRDAILERERRWARPVGLAALAPLVLYIAAVAIEQGAGLYTGASDAQQLRSLHDHSGTILAFSVIRGLAFVVLPIPLLYLFRAAQARNPRVQAALIGFVLIGPLLLAVQGVVQWAAADSVSSDLVSRPAEQARPYSRFQAQLKHDPKSIDQVTIYPAEHQLEVQQADGSFYSVEKYPNPAKVETNLPGQLDGANPAVDHETDSDGLPGDALARNLTDNSSGLQVAQGLLLPAVLGLVVAFVYTSLQALRVGLLTRFVGSLGIALGAAMIFILPFALLALVVWTAYLGLVYLGRVPGGRPPAWDTGEAMPWPRPGEEASPSKRGGGEAIEGDGTEVEPAGERPAPAEGRQPAQRRKRKRRR